MVRFPDVQRQAQEEIDRVIGNNRLPTLADRGKLPYVTALRDEVYRWRPVVSTGSSLKRELTHKLERLLCRVSPQDDRGRHSPRILHPKGRDHCSKLVVCWAPKT